MSRCDWWKRRRRKSQHAKKWCSGARHFLHPGLQEESRARWKRRNASEKRMDNREKQPTGEDPRERTQTHYKADPIRRRGDEFRKSERKRSGRRERKRKSRRRRRRSTGKEDGKCKKSIASLFTLRKIEDVKEKESRQEARRPKVTQTLGKTGRWVLLLLLLEQSGLGVSAAPEGPKKRTEVIGRIQQELQVRGGRWAEEIPQRWRQPKGEDRIVMKKEAELLRYTFR